MSILPESGVNFDFRTFEVEKIDEFSADKFPLVDFAVFSADKILLIEIKSHSEKPEAALEKTKFLAKIKSGALATESLVPKCRCSYTYLDLMELIKERSIVYAVIIPFVEQYTLVALNDRIASGLKKEGKVEWKKEYAKWLGVFNLEEWNKNFGQQVELSPI